MAHCNLNSTRGTDAEATSDIENSVGRETIPQDTVEHLICFASTILHKPSQFFDKHIEINYHQPNRILDAIANISVSQSSGEVVAVAVQVGKTDTKLIVASNGALPDSTITYLKEIWSLLKQLRKDYAAMPPSSLHNMNKALGKDAKMRIVNLRRKILRFCYRRLRQRVFTKDYSNFMGLKGFRASVLGLESTIKQLEEMAPRLNDAALANDKTCDLVGLALEHMSCRLRQCSKAIEQYDNAQQYDFLVSRYLFKIVSIHEDFVFLLQAAYQPALNDIWQRDFQIINVKGSGDIPSNDLKPRVPWPHLIDDTLRLCNIVAEEKGLVRYVLNESDVRRHVVKMCRTPLREQEAQFVHCELTIVSYILQSSEQGFLDYIGISNLSCNGCLHFLQAVKSVLGHRFRVMEDFQIYHYPWAFPDIPHAASVAEQMRKTLSFDVGQVYRGFHPENKRWHSDGSDDYEARDYTRQGCFRRCLKKLIVRAKYEECGCADRLKGWY